MSKRRRQARIAALWATGRDAETTALTERLLALDGGRAAFEARARAARKWDAPASLIKEAKGD